VRVAIILQLGLSHITLLVSLIQDCATIPRGSLMKVCSMSLEVAQVWAALHMGVKLGMSWP